ncbi:MAG: PilX N-terminal domain-containing pilus assembly protein [Methylobacter sp.]|nr:PilX N-terminal domain-containing pilus assembly protein [Methylobacter sp.]MDP2429740.1 PilX N-terminal domain-containing pilus assembly protein [Methylobacter sp.]MDP3054338.1 PilX N-terminal domain-containing pilus assembly protein [Methylobacter sp.]MDP3361014.1 PilX N-terminal domain-containing pilus assembly protein [Methylobacter sp.]MDZ4220943.1 PilX N-terminal domain-containing pilus assembly protein [Methylobacter sp.]
MIAFNLNIKSRQQGAATLIVVLVLAMIMGVAALTTARTGIMEQRITGNDIRAREARESAEAGLEFALAYATKSEWVADGSHYAPVHFLKWESMDENGERNFACGSDITPSADCPALALPGSGMTSSGETYTLGELVYTEIPAAFSGSAIRVKSVARNADNSVTATSEMFIVSQAPTNYVPPEVGPTGFSMPPPWVMAGCITSAATGTPDTFLLAAGDTAVISGKSSGASCLPQGHLNVGTWNDANNNGVMDSGESAANSTTFKRGQFDELCPVPNTNNCAWNHAFNGGSLTAAKAAATSAGNVFTSNIPCGAPSGAPIYLIHQNGNINSGAIVGSCSGVGVNNKTIGTPSTPVILIVPSAYGCPKLNGGIVIYGIVYFESTTACASNGWGGADIYGSVIWEGDVDKPNANSRFIAIDFSNDGAINNTLYPPDVLPTTLPYAISAIPGTWKDF